MILIAASLSLLIIYAGTKLLLNTRKEMLGPFFKFISWFIITGGFILLICSLLFICKRGYGQHRHPDLNENATMETCDHTCVKKSLTDSVSFNAVPSFIDPGEVSYDICKCCNARLVHAPWCCKEESCRDSIKNIK